VLSSAGQVCNVRQLTMLIRREKLCIVRIFQAKEFLLCILFILAMLKITIKRLLLP